MKKVIPNLIFSETPSSNFNLLSPKIKLTYEKLFLLLSFEKKDVNFYLDTYRRKISDFKEFDLEKKENYLLVLEIISKVSSQDYDFLKNPYLMYDENKEYDIFTNKLSLESYRFLYDLYFRLFFRDDYYEYIPKLHKINDCSIYNSPYNIDLERLFSEKNKANFFDLINNSNFDEIFSDRSFFVFLVRTTIFSTKNVDLTIDQLIKLLYYKFSSKLLSFILSEYPDFTDYVINNYSNPYIRLRPILELVFEYTDLLSVNKEMEKIANNVYIRKLFNGRFTEFYKISSITEKELEVYFILLDEIGHESYPDLDSAEFLIDFYYKTNRESLKKYIQKYIGNSGESLYRDFFGYRNENKNYKDGTKIFIFKLVSKIYNKLTDDKVKEKYIEYTKKFNVNELLGFEDRLLRYKLPENLTLDLLLELKYFSSRSSKYEVMIYPGGREDMFQEEYLKFLNKIEDFCIENFTDINSYNLILDKLVSILDSSEYVVPSVRYKGVPYEYKYVYSFDLVYFILDNKPSSIEEIEEYITLYKNSMNSFENEFKIGYNKEITFRYYYYNYYNYKEWEMYVNYYDLDDFFF